MKTGVVLQTTKGGKEVKTIESYSLPNTTPLFNLVVGGSHTYFVEDYAVTGWARDDDFDYDNWTEISKTTLENYN